MKKLPIGIQTFSKMASVSLYAETTHSTVTALGKSMTPEQIKHNATGHTSNAFERYFLQNHQETAIIATHQVIKMHDDTKIQSTPDTLF